MRVCTPVPCAASMSMYRYMYACVITPSPTEATPYLVYFCFVSRTEIHSVTLDIVQLCCQVDLATGAQPLHYASMRGNADEVVLLLRAKANVNAKTLRGFTPLHFAYQYEHNECVDLLLEHGAKVGWLVACSLFVCCIACRPVCTYVRRCMPTKRVAHVFQFKLPDRTPPNNQPTNQPPTHTSLQVDVKSALGKTPGQMKVAKSAVIPATRKPFY